MMSMFFFFDDGGDDGGGDDKDRDFFPLLVLPAVLRQLRLLVLAVLVCGCSEPTR